MKTKSFKEILKETIQRNCTDDYDGMFLFFESSVIEAHNEYASQFQQEWIPVEVRLPEEGQRVDLWLVPDDEEKSRRISWTWEKGNTSKITISGCKVTHWIPITIPQPYNPNQQ